MGIGYPLVWPDSHMPFPSIIDAKTSNTNNVRSGSSEGHPEVLAFLVAARQGNLRQLGRLV